MNNFEVIAWLVMALVQWQTQGSLCCRIGNDMEEGTALHSGAKITLRSLDARLSKYILLDFKSVLGTCRTTWFS